jgi:hypothetical protein
MKSIFQRIRGKGTGSEANQRPVLGSGVRFPYGPFQFKLNVGHGLYYEIEASNNLKNWQPIFQGTSKGQTDFLDSDASKFSYRFYRLNAEGVISAHVLGYASVTLAPGFTMVGNPLVGTRDSLPELFKEMPDGTTVSKFDSRQNKLRENSFANAQWSDPSDRIGFGEGAIVFNPSNDYKTLSFVGEVKLEGVTVPIPAGFSIQTSSIPQPGALFPELHFPIGEGDVIHLFDRDQQKYLLYPYGENGWESGSPVVGVAESFWVAKRSGKNWTFDLSEKVAEADSPKPATG